MYVFHQNVQLSEPLKSSRYNTVKKKQVADCNAVINVTSYGKLLENIVLRKTNEPFFLGKMCIKSTYTIFIIKSTYKFYTCFISLLN